MFAQHVAATLSCAQVNEAFESQHDDLTRAAYLFPKRFVILTSDCTQAIYTSKRGQAGRFSSVGYVELDRSNRCPRASSCSPSSVSPLALPHVRSKKKKLSTQSLIHSRSASSRFTPVSTSKRLSGRAFAPVPFSNPPSGNLRTGASLTPIPQTQTQEGWAC